MANTLLIAGGDFANFMSYTRAKNSGTIHLEYYYILNDEQLEQVFDRNNPNTVFWTTNAGTDTVVEKLRALSGQLMYAVSTQSFQFGNELLVNPNADPQNGWSEKEEARRKIIREQIQKNDVNNVVRVFVNKNWIRTEPVVHVKGTNEVYKTDAPAGIEQWRIETKALSHIQCEWQQVDPETLEVTTLAKPANMNQFELTTDIKPRSVLADSPLSLWMQYRKNYKQTSEFKCGYMILYNDASIQDDQFGKIYDTEDEAKQAMIDFYKTNMVGKMKIAEFPEYQSLLKAKIGEKKYKAPYGVCHYIYLYINTRPGQRIMHPDGQHVLNSFKVDLPSRSITLASGGIPSEPILEVVPAKVKTNITLESMHPDLKNQIGLWSRLMSKITPYGKYTV